MNTVSVASATNDGAHAVVVFQRRCGHALKWIGSCVQIRNAGTENYNDAYEYCIGIDGDLRRMTIPQASDPTPMQISARSDAELMQKLYKLWESTRTKNLTFNLGVFLRTCLKAGEERSAANFDRQFWFYDLKGVGRVQFGNDTLVTDNYKQTALQEDQLDFVNSNISVTSPYIGSVYTLQQPAVPTSFPTNGFNDLIVLDSANAGSKVCGDGRDRPGGKILIGSHRTNPDVFLSTDYGFNWTNISSSVGSSPARVFAFNGYAYAVTSSAIYVGVPNAAGTAVAWTLATTNNAFSALSNVESGQNGVLVVGGANGQIWHSYDAGASWVRVANVSVFTNAYGFIDFKQIVNLNGTLMAVGRTASNAQTAFVRSMDNGLTWSLDGYIVAAAPTFYEGTAQDWRVVWNLGGTLYQHEKGSVASNTINPVGIASVVKFFVPNPLNCNDVIILSSGKIQRSLDGGVTAQDQDVSFTLGANTTLSVANVSHIDGDYMLVAYGGILFKLSQRDTFWT